MACRNAALAFLAEAEPTPSTHSGAHKSPACFCRSGRGETHSLSQPVTTQAECGGTTPSGEQAVDDGFDRARLFRIDDHRQRKELSSGMEVKAEEGN